MATFKTIKPCLIVILFLSFHSPSVYIGEALTPATVETKEGITTKQQPETNSPENMPLRNSSPFPTPAINQNFPFARSINNPGQQPAQTADSQQQGLGYSQQNPSQPLSGLTQPFSSVNQPFLGVNNQPFGVANQQGLAGGTPINSGVAEMKSFALGAAMVYLLNFIATFGFIV